jgi:hypothetical protein
MGQRDVNSPTYQYTQKPNQQEAKKEKTTVYISHPTYPLIKAEAEA